MTSNINKAPYVGGQAANPGVLRGTAGVSDFPAMPVRGRRLAIRASWAATGTPVGVFSLQHDFGDDDWADVPGASVEFTANGQAQPAGTAAKATWNWSNIPGSRWRIRYTWTSGTAGTVVMVYTQGD